MAGFDPCTPDVVLALARHAAGLTRSPKINPEFQIRVHAEVEKRRGPVRAPWADRFHHYPVEKFLDNGPDRALLIGLPGAGKTYSFRRAASRLAEKLHEACLSEAFDEKAVIVPILVDLKLYCGNLLEFVRQTLPKSLPLDELTRHFKVKIFLDSFNEMPREYLENGSYESDFAKFTATIGDASFVIGSRTSDGLKNLGLPAYSLDEIDAAAVKAELQRLDIEIEGRFDHEVRRLLQRPFYFQYITSGAVRLSKEAHPRDFYQVFFENLRKAFATRFSRQLDIEKALSLAAYDALNRGKEAFPLSELLRVLKTSAEMVDLANIDVLDVANWLVSFSVLIPHTDGRIAFVHQSVTEYLAATELARRYQTSPNILKKTLSLTRWDQALFLTLSLLPPAQAEVFLQDVIKADFALALNAVKYLEVGRDEVMTKLLSEIPERIQASRSSPFEIPSAVRSGLPLTIAHEPYLRRLIKCGGLLGSAAVARLVALKGAEVKDELLQLLVDHNGDYNFCLGIAHTFKPFATDEDAKKITTWADTIQGKVTPDFEDNDKEGFTEGAAAFLSGLDLSTLRREFLPRDESVRIPEIRARIFCSILREHHSTAALDLAGELILRGVKEADLVIFFISEIDELDCELSWASFTAAHIDRLEAFFDNNDVSWGLRYDLKCLCAARPDLAELVKQRASKKSGIKRAALLSCVSPTDFTPVFQALCELIEMSDEERRKQPIQILEHIEFDWTGKEDLFVKLLRLRDIQLTLALIGNVFPPVVPTLGNLEIGPIDWWLEWMLEIFESGTDSACWFIDILGGAFAIHLNSEVQDKFVADFNKSGSKFRRLLLHFVLPHRSDITTEVFSEDAIFFLLADLSREWNLPFVHEPLLSNTATEQFVTGRLLPLLPDAKQPLLKNLHEVLRHAGSRHGRRYVLE